MRERSERALRIGCVCLAALLLYQFTLFVARRDPLANLSIPALPSLPPATNAPTASHSPNLPSSQISSKATTNSLEKQAAAKKATNVVLEKASTTAGTNLASGQAPDRAETNALARQKAAMRAATAVSNQASGATEMISIPRPGSGSTRMSPGPSPEMAMMGMNPLSRPGPGTRGSPLPPPIQARVDRITDSELLAPIIRPLPMALLGIAGECVFLRAPDGQTGLVKEGDGVGGVKLLRIGVNRVLVEENGQKKELTIFSGLGGESLLPKEKESPQ